MKEQRVGLDSQCFSYLLDALEGVRDPMDSLAEERKALVRIWLYTPGTFYLTDMVIRESTRIRAEGRRLMHDSWRGVHFVDVPILHPKVVEQRALSLTKSHAHLADCRILAEAEDQNLQVLLTYDDAFIRRLGASSKVALTTPSGFWTELGIPRGAQPNTIPDPSNPMSQETWWHWTE